MTRIRDIANILSSSTSMATDAEVTSAISAQFVAGKNKIINGNFGIWQRGTSFTTAGYTADRWTISLGGGSGANTTSQQSFTAGTAPVAGYEGQYFLRWNQTTGASGNPTLMQKIEDVRTFAGQTVIVSFWAKVASAGTPLASIVLAQEFGSGGSANVNATLVNSPSLTTSWTRYTYSVAVPSISGKTLGTGNNLSLVFYGNSSTTYTFDIWGVQLEAGSTATNFSLATGTFATELAACQRYYQTSFDLGQTPAHNGSYYGEMTLSCVNGGFSTNSYGAILFPTKMRTAPTVNIWNSRNASVSGNSARFYNSGTAYETSSIDMGVTTSSSHGLTFKGTNIGASAIVFFGYSASAEL
jgi:hypothetical protein